MSESPRHSRLSGSSNQAFLVRPQPITETSLIDSVAGFINEVQSLHHHSTQSQMGDDKVHVTWAKFERTDVNDAALFSEQMEINGNHPPLLLVLGYTHGLQVWLVPASGEAQEVLAWKHGQFRTLKVLPTPDNVFGSHDNFGHLRPLVVVVDSTGPGTAFISATFTSLKSGEQVQSIKFKSEISDVAANRRVVVVVFKEKLAAFDACTLQPRFTVTSCYPSPGVHTNPIALGDRWLAYADQKLVNIHRSMGGMEMDGNQSVTAWGINVGSKLAQGVSKIYSNIFSTSSQTARSAHLQRSALSAAQNEPQKGVVTILDIVRVYRQDRDDVLMSDKIDGVVAHFIAHNKAIVAMEFDANGSLLLTCDRLGNYFNLFRIVPHPSGSCYTAVHHLYSLYRGDTPGSVQDIAFSPDSRWVAVSTLRGTTHIFPITPYGGPVGVRTHTSSRVVNRLSRFHRSAGLDEHTPAGRTNSSGRSSPNPILGSSPVFSKMSLDPISSMMLVIPFPNPHVPPFPTPTLIQPVAQLRQPYLVTLTSQTLGSAASGVGARKPKPSGSSTAAANLDDVPIRLAVAFAPSRAWLLGASQNTVFQRQPRRVHDSLFVVANHGVLLEYILDPMPDSTLSKDKICESSPIELQVSAYGQWTMPPPGDHCDLQPPLAQGNPLMCPLEHIRGSHSLKKDMPMGLELNNEDHWLSQVEIVTHIGPHRRLWMGPQFCFKTFRRADSGGNDNEASDVSLTYRLERSNPMNMPSTIKGVPVLIEAGSASSYELSPHLSNQMSHHHRGSREQVHHDVESELQEAMSENVLAEESLLDGPSGSTHVGHGALSRAVRKSSLRYHSHPHTIGPRGESSSAEEEIFCLTPEDARSIASSGRSRNASSTSVNSAKIAGSFPVQMGGLPDTKIFSVAVEARHTEVQPSDTMLICDVDTDFSGRFAVVSTIPKKAHTVSEIAEKRVEKLQGASRVLKPEKQEQPAKPVTKAGSGSKTRSKKKKNRCTEEGEDEATAAVVTKPSIIKKQECDQDFDVVPLKTEDYFRDITPKIEEEELFEMTTNNSFQDAFNDTTEQLLADALMSVEVEGPGHQAVLKEERSISPTPSDEFMVMTKQTKHEEDEERFFIRESNSVSPDPIPPQPVTRTSLANCLEDFLGPDASLAIVNSIQVASKLYGGDDEDEDETRNSSADCRLFNRAKKLEGCLADSSEDDTEFQPITRRQKRSKKKDGAFLSETPGSSCADSESSLLDEPPTSAGVSEKQEGWSFEADDLDISKLIAEVAINQQRRQELTAAIDVTAKDEKTPLEDIFKFDSELVVASNCDADEDDEDDKSSNAGTTAEESENDAQYSSSRPQPQIMAHSMREYVDSKSKDSDSLSKSLVYGGSTSAESSSVGNSPNPKNVKKSRSKRKGGKRK